MRLAVALKLAERGFYLFPLRPNAKSPAIKNWKNKATLDPDQLARWFGGKQAYNIGIATERSGLVVIDCDVKREGVNGVDNFVRLAGGIEPDTFTVETPSGGLHAYFKGDAVASTAGQLAPGVDVRSRGGLVVAPGSTIDGTPYRANDGGPSVPAPIPTWLVAAIAEAYTAAAPVARLATCVDLDTDIAVERARAYLADEAPAAIQGQGGDETTYKVACRVRDMGVSEGLACELMSEIYDPRCVPAWGEDGITAKVANAYSYGQNSPGSASAAADFDIITDWNPEPANDNFADINALLAEAVDAERGIHRAGGLAYQRACDIAQKPIEWLWPGHFAIGKIGGIAGVQGDGKSQIMCYIAATISSGGDWPDGVRAKPGKVIILSAEDDPADTTAPRLTAAKADLANCLIVSPVVETKGGKRALNLSADVDRIERLIDQNPDTVALLIDPISAYLGEKADAHRNTEVRALLTPLGELAERRRIAVIFVTHFNKSGKGSGLSRVTDSMAFTALARTFWLVIKEQAAGKETGRMLFLDVKRNITKREAGHRYSISGVSLPGGIETSLVVWGDRTATTVDEALSEDRRGRPPVARHEASAFLADLLGRGAVLATEVQEAAKGEGIALRTIRRAAEELHVEKEKRADGWYWKLPIALIDHDEDWAA